MTCRRCNARVGFNTGDPETFGCYSCGEVPIEVSPQGSPDAASKFTCPDCGAGVYREGNRCMRCSGIARAKRKKTTHRGAPIVITPPHHSQTVAPVRAGRTRP